MQSAHSSSHAAPLALSTALAYARSRTTVSGLLLHLCPRQCLPRGQPRRTSRPATPRPRQLQQPLAHLSRPRASHLRRRLPRFTPCPAHARRRPHLDMRSVCRRSMSAAVTKSRARWCSGCACTSPRCAASRAAAAPPGAPPGPSKSYRHIRPAPAAAIRISIQLPRRRREDRSISFTTRHDLCITSLFYLCYYFSVLGFIESAPVSVLRISSLPPPCIHPPHATPLTSIPFPPVLAVHIVRSLACFHFAWSSFASVTPGVAFIGFIVHSILIPLYLYVSNHQMNIFMGTSTCEIALEEAQKPRQ